MNNQRHAHIYFLLLFALFLLITIPYSTLFAQTGPEETAVPYPIATTAPTNESGYPSNPPTPTPANPTPYPIFTATPRVTAGSIPVVGDDLAPFITAVPPEATPAVNSGDLIQSTLVLWIGFIIGLLILGTGIYGAIILYTRK